MAKNYRTTITEIARQSGTTPTAVSVVLNGARSNTRVSAETRSRIVSVASELNYSPNVIAQGLKRQRTRTVGVLFGWGGAHALNNQFSVGLLDGIMAGAGEAKHRVLMYTEQWCDAETSASAFVDSSTDGVIVVAPLETSDVLPALAALRVPLVLLSSSTHLPGIDFVDIDNARGVVSALDHLWELGHRRIAYAGHTGFGKHMRERFEAYLAWMVRRGIPIQDNHILGDLYPVSGSDRVGHLEELLRLPDRPTAIFAVTDDLAADVLVAARAVGLTVPEQLSVVGFDDTLLASLTTPKLTTVRQPLLEMGQQAVRMLISIIGGKGGTIKSSPGHVIVPELIVRYSTAPAVTAGKLL